MGNDFNLRYVSAKYEEQKGMTKNRINRHFVLAHSSKQLEKEEEARALQKTVIEIV